MEGWFGQDGHTGCTGEVLSFEENRPIVQNDNIEADPHEVTTLYTVWEKPQNHKTGEAATNDDVLVLTQGTFLDTAMNSMQLILKKVDRWCAETGLTVNPAKTELVIFTRKHRVEQCANLTLRGNRIGAKESAKYLGVILDRKLKWKEHMEFQVRKFCTALWACRKTVGVTWGLKPNTLLWIYKAILLPRLTYASVVWWPRVKLTRTRDRLEKLRGLMLRGATGAMRTTPTKALGIIMDVPPIHVEVQAVAVNAAHSLRSLGLWKHGTKHTRLELLNDPILCMRGDWMSARIAEEPAWQTIFPSREDWLSKQDSLPGTGK
uniref:Reverse transcriptase domain-containing protein n=1 Tax=Trichogramma kaykai TaxID=54128 RepID=A0ABD2WCX8_9HYME